VVISNVSHSFFTGSQPPPPPGGTNTHTFGSQVDMMVSLDNGATFQAVRTPGDVTVRVTDTGGGTYDTEMLQLSLGGGGLPAGVMIRESPTRASLGRVAIGSLPPGDPDFDLLRVASFFDIFVDVSLDGGNTWSPATNGPAHVELANPAPEQTFPTNTLPPPNGQYVSPQQWHALYAQGIVISNISHKRFTESQPPPPPGQTNNHTFGSDVEFDLIRPGQPTVHLTAPASVNVRVASSANSGSTRYFDTEMLALNISGGGLPSQIRLRESPTKASLGRTSMRQRASDGSYRVSSFFDIFTEISLDGGATWSPQLNNPPGMALVQSPVNPCVGPASLKIVPSLKGDSVTITWSGTGFRLQSTTALDGPAATVWTDVPGASGVTLSVKPGMNTFYRVICP